jgi:hypothetical protein
MAQIKRYMAKVKNAHTQKAGGQAGATAGLPPSSGGSPSSALPEKRKTGMYYAQNQALHKARAQLGWSLDELRAKAAELNLGIASLSKLSLTQRHALLVELLRCGATVRNPTITRYDLEEEQRASGKLTRFPYVTDAQLQMLAALAGQVQWREQDGYLRFCLATIKAPAPRNGREVTTIRLALESLIRQQSPLPSVGEGR